MVSDKILIDKIAKMNVYLKSQIKMEGKKKRKTCWNNNYCQKYGFLKPDSTEEEKAFCCICSTKFSISYGGIADIKKHIDTNKHKSTINASTSSCKVQQYFTNKNEKDQDLKIAAKEGIWAYNTARHNISFSSNDCSAAMNRCMFDTKFTSGKTKTSALINNVVSPFIEIFCNQNIKRWNENKLKCETIWILIFKEFVNLQ